MEMIEPTTNLESIDVSKRGGGGASILLSDRSALRFLSIDEPEYLSSGIRFSRLLSSMRLLLIILAKEKIIE